MKNLIRDDILSYREMCDNEGVQTLQRGMNFRMHPGYSVVLMSRRANAPYKDEVLDDGQTIKYEGHDRPKESYLHNPKLEDQVQITDSGKLTQNGKFVKAARDYKNGKAKVEFVKVYEKVLPGVWSLKGLFELSDYEEVIDTNRKVFRFLLKLALNQNINIQPGEEIVQHTRIIPSQVKKEVWIRDKGQCVICNSRQNLHFDHELPYSLGGTSLTAKNVRLLCMKHNLQKSAKIE